MKKPYILGAVAAVALLAAAYFFVLPGLKGSKSSANSTADLPATPYPYRPRGEARVPGLMYPLSERVLNLASTGSTPHYVRIQLTIEFARPYGAKISSTKPTKEGSATPLDPLLQPVQERSAQIDDALVRIAGSTTLDSITSPSGQEQFKHRLLDAVAQITPGLDPINVYIQELVAQ